ncbi:hypothetical protein ABZ671_00415 [Micromonospora sp. NPDC006766]|uniref:hypothetical protein n=1 Tax=Micromonospora sp. NPDC006766 TaxID=3154778 RepID=UPI0033F74CC6
MAHDPSDWQRLGRHVVHRREQLGLTQAAVHHAGGPSAATQRVIENGSQTSYRGAILRSLERVLQWPDGTIDNILNGAEPPSAMPATPLADLEQLEPELRHHASDPYRSEGIRAWARSLLDQIDQLRKAAQQEDEDREAS